MAPDPPKALPRKEGVTQPGSPASAGPFLRRLWQHRRTRRLPQRASGTQRLLQRACGGGQGWTPTRGTAPIPAAVT